MSQAAILQAATSKRPPYGLLKDIIAPEKWRHILRGLLRESSYLPDPIARSVCHDQIMSRYRRYHDESRPKVLDDIPRQVSRLRSAQRDLSTLQRANEGYHKPLEKVLWYAYGRSGKRRRDMLRNLLASDIPLDSSAVTTLYKKVALYSDEWKPPAIVIELLKSQNSNPFVTQIYNHRPIRDLEPRFPKKATWNDKLSISRRRNIRREWYQNVLSILLPPLPDSELRVLDGLISSEIDWVPPKRRVNLELARLQHDAAGERIRSLLTAGPAKVDTFEDFTSGRPHHITKRFMIRLWQRLSCLIPRAGSDPKTGRCQFTWEKHKPIRDTLARELDPEQATKLFGVERRDKKPKRRRRDIIPEFRLPE